MIVILSSICLFPIAAVSYHKRSYIIIAGVQHVQIGDTLFTTLCLGVTFEQGWQKFLGLAEKMPGLRKEVVGDIDELVFGPPNMNYKKVQELYFDSREELETALKSDVRTEGRSMATVVHAGTFLVDDCQTHGSHP